MNLNLKYGHIMIVAYSETGGAIAQSVEQWSRNPVTRVRNQYDALVPFRKALILITRSLGEDLKPSAVWLLTDKHFLLS